MPFNFEKLVPFIMNHQLLWISLTLIVIAIIIFEIRAKSHAPESISPETAVQRINHQNAVVFDIRNQEAFRKGHIINAESVSADNITKLLTGSSSEKYKDKPVIIVCEQGIQAQKAAALLKKEGIEQVSIIKGGINAWLSANLPLEKSK